MIWISANITFKVQFKSVLCHISVLENIFVVAKNKDTKRTTMLIRTIFYHLEHNEPFKNILDLFRTIWDHLGPFGNILKHFETFKTISSHLGQFKTN